MGRVLLVVVALALLLGAILVRLWAGGLSLKTAAKMAALGAGFVVSVKMMLSGYLALQAQGKPSMIEVFGFYGSLALAVFFGIATFILWRRGANGC